MIEYGTNLVGGVTPRRVEKPFRKYTKLRFLSRNGYKGMTHQEARSK